MRILYLGWVGFGNLGDDVCRDLFVQQVRIALGERAGSCEVVSLTHGGFSEEKLRAIRPDWVVLGGGSLLALPYLGPLLAAQRHGIRTAIWGTGFDSRALRVLDDLAGRRRSTEPWLAPETADVMRRAAAGCEWIGVRGPLTLEILRASGCDAPAAHVCGDPGLLLEAAPAPAATAPLSTWIARREPIVAINWGTAYNRVYGGDEAATAAALSEVIRALLLHYRVVLYAVWGEDLSRVRRLAAPFAGHPNLSFLTAVPSGPALAGILSHCAFSINFKLHANVFSAAAGCPFVALAYRLKSFDFATSLGCEALVARCDRPRLADWVLDACARIEAERDEWRTRIIARRDHYRARVGALTRALCAPGTSPLGA